MVRGGGQFAPGRRLDDAQVVVDLLVVDARAVARVLTHLPARAHSAAAHASQLQPASTHLASSRPYPMWGSSIYYVFTFCNLFLFTYTGSLEISSYTPLMSRTR